MKLGESIVETDAIGYVLDPSLPLWGTVIVLLLVAGEVGAVEGG